VTQRWKAKRTQKLPLTNAWNLRAKADKSLLWRLHFRAAMGFAHSVQAKRPPQEKGKRQSAGHGEIPLRSRVVKRDKCDRGPGALLRDRLHLPDRLCRALECKPRPRGSRAIQRILPVTRAMT
jgi:hypothetical protein